MSYYSGSYHGSTYYDSIYYGPSGTTSEPEPEIPAGGEPEIQAGGGAFWGHEKRTTNDDDKVVMAVIKSFLEEINLEL